MSKGARNDSDGKMFYQEPLQEILRFIDEDYSHAEDCYPLVEALHRMYQTFSIEYNRGRISHSIDIEHRWVDIQLALLPDYLLLLGKRTKSVGLYKKILCTHPFLLKYPQTYRFLGRYILRTNPLFRKISKNLRSSKALYGIRSVFFQ